MKNEIEGLLSNFIAKEKHKAWEQQYALSQVVVEKANINIVTCGSCGSVMLHSCDAEKIECPHCGFSSEPCDFPDLYHFRSLEDFEVTINNK